MKQCDLLIIGGSGLLGVNWAQQLKTRGSVVLGLHERTISLPGVATCRENFLQADALKSAVDRYEPRAIINCAGLASVEKCEEQPELAEKLNVKLAENIAKLSARDDIPFVHISTDHLFSTPGVHNETSEVSPVNEYARSKAAGEAAVLAVNSNALVIRTNFYGWAPSYRSSFSDWILGELRQKNEIKLFDDVLFSPIWMEALIDSVHGLLEHNASGIYNVCSDDQLTKADFGFALAKAFKLDQSFIRNSKLADVPELVKRPNAMGLSNLKCQEILGRKLGTVSEHLAQLVETEFASSTKEIQQL